MRKDFDFKIYWSLEVIIYFSHTCLNFVFQFQEEPSWEMALLMRCLFIRAPYIQMTYDQEKQDVYEKRKLGNNDDDSKTES